MLDTDSVHCDNRSWRAISLQYWGAIRRTDVAGHGWSQHSWSQLDDVVARDRLLPTTEIIHFSSHGVQIIADLSESWLRGRAASLTW